MHTVPDLHRGTCLSWPSGPLQKAYQKVHMNHTTTQHISCWGRGQQEVGAGVAYRRNHDGILSTEADVHDGSHFGFC